MKKVTTLLLVVMMVVWTCSVPAYAIDTNDFHEKDAIVERYSLNVVTPEAAAEIERLAEENNTLRETIQNEDSPILSRQNNQEFLNKIENNKEKMESLGASTPSDELLIDLIKAEIKQSGIQVASDWDPSQIVSDFKGMYDMSASYSTTYGGKTQYHVVFQHNGNDSHLKNIQSEKFYNGISAGSAEARNWVNEVIKIYAEKLVGEGLGLLHPALSLIPYELLGIAVKPNSQKITSTRDATIVSLNTTSIQKFVYVYNSSSRDWFFALSTNKISYSTTVSQLLTVSGKSYNKSNDYNYRWEYGDYNKAASDADSAYNSGYSKKTCVNKVAGYSTSKGKDVVIANIFTPTYVSHMI